MDAKAKRWLLATGLILAVGNLSVAFGQFPIRTIPSAQQMVNPNPLFLYGQSQQQYLMNIQNYAHTMRQFPPWMFGFNPYPPTVVTPFPPSPYPPYPGPIPYGGYGGAQNLYAPTPAYPASPGSYGSNPYMPTPSPYSDQSNPYSAYLNPYGGYLSGQADVMRAYGSLMNQQEQARLLREQYYQTKIDTAKKKFDYDLYVKANTLTYNQEQAKINKDTLKRIQENSNPAEILSGKAQNFLLSDLAKHPNKEVSLDSQLEPEILKQLNIRKKSTFGNLGVLRDGGKLNWPAAFGEVLNEEERKKIEARTHFVVTQAQDGKIENNVLTDLRKNVEDIRERLFKKQNDVPTGQYIEGKRFLNDLHDACLAVEKGDVAVNAKFQKQATEGKFKSVQELTKYLNQNGLEFAPAVTGDEGAYQAIHSALVALDVTVNGQVAANKE